MYQYHSRQIPNEEMNVGYQLTYQSPYHKIPIYQKEEERKKKEDFKIEQKYLVFQWTYWFN